MIECPLPPLHSLGLDRTDGARRHPSQRGDLQQRGWGVVKGVIFE